MNSFGATTEINWDNNGSHADIANDMHGFQKPCKDDSCVSLTALQIRSSSSTASCDELVTTQSMVSSASESDKDHSCPPSADVRRHLRQNFFTLEADSKRYLRLILSSRVYDAIERTPLITADTLSYRLGYSILLKREDLLPGSSYKIRGVYNKMSHLHQDERWRGVVTYSTGSQALSVAIAAKKLRIPSVIVMPRQTPDSIRQRLSRLNSTLIIHGTSLEAAKVECSRLQQLHRLTDVSSCQDPFVVAGHGSVGLEILNQVSDVRRVEAIVCPIGCGSLIAGLGLYVKRVAPHISIIGVESDNDGEHFDQCALQDTSLKKPLLECSASNPASIDAVCTWAEIVDDIVRVSIAEVSAASEETYEETGRILERFGVMSIAGLKKWVAANRPFASKAEIIAVTSEANVDYFAIPNIIKQTAAAFAKEF